MVESRCSRPLGVGTAWRWSQPWHTRTGLDRESSSPFGASAPKLSTMHGCVSILAPRSAHAFSGKSPSVGSSGSAWIFGSWRVPRTSCVSYAATLSSLICGQAMWPPPPSRPRGAISRHSRNSAVKKTTRRAGWRSALMPVRNRTAGGYRAETAGVGHGGTTSLTKLAWRRE